MHGVKAVPPPWGVEAVFPLCAALSVLDHAGFARGKTFQRREDLVGKCRRGISEEPPFTFGMDQSGRVEDLRVVRDRRLRESKGLIELRARHLASFEGQLDD